MRKRFLGKRFLGKQGATFVAAVALWGLATLAQAATFPTILRVVPGPNWSGLAASVRVTIYDNQHNVLVSSSNAPGGTAFAEEGTGTGSYWVPYTVDTSKLPISVVPGSLTNGQGVSVTLQPAVIGNERAAEVADGYTASRAAQIDSLATLVARADPATALATIQAVTDRINGMLELSGAAYRFTAPALARAPVSFNINTRSPSGVPVNTH